MKAVPVQPTLPADLAAATLTRRDWQRVQALHDEVIQLRRRVAELENAPSRRAFAPARNLLRVLRSRPPGKAAEPLSGRGRALIVDDRWPQPERDAGSARIVGSLHALGQLGFDVMMAARREHDGAHSARDRLRAAGIHCAGPSDAPSVEDLLRSRGPSLDLVVLCRVFSGGALLEQARAACGRARIVFDSIDLNFVREERRARLTDDVGLMDLVPALRERELAVVAASDATLVVSAAEAALLAELAPAALVGNLPLSCDLAPPRTPFAERSGFGFVGGWEHAPNADGVRWFLDAVWPRIRAHAPGHALSLVGAGVPEALAAPDVRVCGPVDDLGPWFEGLRATVAPLRFGAGAKGKVALSLAAGVPCVATTIAAEGMGLSEASGVLVANSDEAFAAAALRVCTDEALWRRLSAGALAYAERELSPARGAERLDGFLRRLGL